MSEWTTVTRRRPKKTPSAPGKTSTINAVPSRLKTSPVVARSLGNNKTTQSKLDATATIASKGKATAVPSNVKSESSLETLVTALPDELKLKIIYYLVDVTDLDLHEKEGTTFSRQLDEMGAMWLKVPRLAEIFRDEAIKKARFHIIITRYARKPLKSWPALVGIRKQLQHVSVTLPNKLQLDGILQWNQALMKCMKLLPQVKEISLVCQYYYQLFYESTHKLAYTLLQSEKSVSILLCRGALYVKACHHLRFGITEMEIEAELRAWGWAVSEASERCFYDW